MHATKNIAALFKSHPVSLAVIPAIVIALSFGLNYAYATWAEPVGTPPNNNTDAPLNVGPAAQTKSGPLTLGTSLTLPQGNTLQWSGGGFMYSDSSNTAIRQPGAFYVQHADGSLADTVSHNTYGNDFYIGAIGKWASQMGGGGTQYASGGVVWIL